MDDDFNADFICMGTNENEVSLLEKKREGHAICAALYCKVIEKKGNLMFNMIVLPLKKE